MDAINYLLFKNPVATSSWSALQSFSSLVIGAANSDNSSNISSIDVKNIMMEFLRSNRNYVRILGLFGSTAVILGAYGAHSLLNKENISQHRKDVFKTANQYHFYNLIAFTAVPFCKFPKITAILIGGGILIFCGSCYYQSFTGDDKPKPITPYGGTLLILGWLSMLL